MSIKDKAMPYLMLIGAFLLMLIMYWIGVWLGEITGLGLIGGIILEFVIMFIVSFLYGWFVLAKPNKPEPPVSIYSLPKAS